MIFLQPEVPVEKSWALNSALPKVREAHEKPNVDLREAQECQGADVDLLLDLAMEASQRFIH